MDEPCSRWIRFHRKIEEFDLSVKERYTSYCDQTCSRRRGLRNSPASLLGKMIEFDKRKIFTTSQSDGRLHHGQFG